MRKIHKKAKSAFPLRHFIIALVAVAIPISLLFYQTQGTPLQSVLQSTTGVTPPPACNENLSKITLENDCGPASERKFRQISFTCVSGASRTMGSKNERCATAGAWVARAVAYCREKTPTCRSLTPTCTRIGVKQFDYGSSCSGGYNSVTSYECSDGSTGSIPAEGNKCFTAIEWNRKVAAACNQRSSCAPTPTPTTCQAVRLAEGSGPRNGCSVSGYKNFLVKCTDDYSETLTDTNGKDRCTSLSEWQAKARNFCMRRTACQ